MKRITRIVLAAFIAFFVSAVLGVHVVSGQTTLNASTNKFVYHHSDSSGDTRFYDYAPSVIVDGNTEYIYTCHNSTAGVIIDNVWLTEIDIPSGNVTFDQSVLQPTPGSWDSVHTCDPTVIRTNATLNGNAYTYVMFYLGTDQSDDNHNQIGVAFSNAPEGPWVKFAGTVVGYDSSVSGCNNGGAYTCCGVGQPSVTSIDGNGRVLLFWSGSAGAFRADINIGNISDNGNWPVWNSYLALPTGGLTDANGNADWIDNIDVAYDPTRDRFYAVREEHNNAISYCSQGNPTYICERLQLVSIPGNNIWSGSGNWTVEAEINSALTGFPRNHNAGLKKNWYGGVLDPSSVGVLYTVSCADGTSYSCSALNTIPEWTYALWEIDGSVQ